MNVTLTPAEVMNAAYVGMRRHVSALSRGLKDKHGANDDQANRWSTHIEGACGEAALAKALGVWWSGSVDTFRGEADVGLIEVRTRSRHSYDLIVRDDDKDDSAYVLLTGIAPSYMVRGWMMGREAKQPRWLADHGGHGAAYFIPQRNLRPITQLLGSLE